MIPKIIHYCWFGGNPLPEDAKRYIESWKKYCPDYEIKEWSEQTFDVHSIPYVKEAFEAKKWAFITDYVRLWAVYNYGGIYMDTDVEVLKPLDEFLKHHAFSGFESSCNIPTGIMAGEKGNLWFKLQLDYYTDRHFKRVDGSLDLTTNVVTITNITRQNYHIQLDNTYQDCGDIVFYPSEYFCPKNHETGIIELTGNSYTIHHFAGSWLADWQQQVREYHRKIVQQFGDNLVSKTLWVLYYGRMALKNMGFFSTINFVFEKIRKS